MVSKKIFEIFVLIWNCGLKWQKSRSEKNFLKINLRVFLCEKSIAHIAEAWKRVLYLENSSFSFALLHHFFFVRSHSFSFRLFRSIFSFKKLSFFRYHIGLSSFEKFVSVISCSIPFCWADTTLWSKWTKLLLLQRKDDVCEDWIGSCLMR